MESAEAKESRLPVGSRKQLSFDDWVPGFSNERIAQVFMDAPQQLGYQKGAVITQVRFKAKGDGWQVMIKACKGSEFGVAFLDSRTFAECVELLSEAILKDKLRWRRDKYPG